MNEPLLTRRRFVALGGTLALAGASPLLGGCGGTAPAAPPTLRVHLSLSAYERAFFARAIVPPFEQAQNVRVALADRTTDEAIEDLYADRARFDLLAVDTERLGALIADRLALDVSDQRPTLAAPILPSTLGALERAGRLHALPYRPTAWVTFYNRALLARASVEPPRTWDDLLTAAARLRDAAGGRVALQGASGAPAAQSLVELIWAFGGDPLAPVDAGALAAGDYLARLAPLLAPGARDAKFDTLTAALAADRVALGPNWPIVAADLVQRGGKPEIAVAATLAGPAGDARVLSGQVLIVPTGSRQPALALALAAHLRSREVQRSLVGQLAWFPLRDDAFDAAPAWQTETATALREALRTARAVPPLANREAFDLALGTAFRRIAFEGIAPASALAQAAAAVTSLR